MTDYCDACGQTTLGEGSVKVLLPAALAQYESKFRGQMGRRRSVFQGIDRYLGWRVEDRLSFDKDYLHRLTELTSASLATLGEYRLGKLARAKGDDKNAVRHVNLMMDALLQIAGECVWMIADYGYPLSENVPELLRRLAAEDREVSD